MSHPCPHIFFQTQAMGMAAHEGDASTHSHPENHVGERAAVRDLRRDEPTVGKGLAWLHDRVNAQNVGGVYALWFELASFLPMLI